MLISLALARLPVASCFLPLFICVCVCGIFIYLFIFKNPWVTTSCFSHNWKITGNFHTYADTSCFLRLSWTGQLDSFLWSFRIFHLDEWEPAQTRCFLQFSTSMILCISKRGLSSLKGFRPCSFCMKNETFHNGLVSESYSRNYPRNNSQHCVFSTQFRALVMLYWDHCFAGPSKTRPKRGSLHRVESMWAWRRYWSTHPPVCDITKCWLP